MSTLKNLQDRRNQLLHEAQRVALADKTPENRAKLATMLADVEAIESDIEQEQRLNALVAKNNAATTEAIRQNPNANGLSGASKEERAAKDKAALTHYMRTGRVADEHRDILRSPESRDIGAGGIQGSISTDGSVLVPTSFDNLLFEAQKSWGVITSLVRNKVTASGSPMRVAGVDDTANSFTIIAEDTTVSEVDPALSGITSKVSEMTSGVVLVSRAELQDSAFDVADLLSNSFGKRYWRGVSNYIVNGSSDSNFTSLLTGVAAGATSTSPTAIEWFDIAALYGQLEPAYLNNATWVSNNVTRAAIMTLTDNYGRPIFVPSPNSGQFDTVLGRPFAVAQQLPNVAATSVSLLFGDFQELGTFRQVQSDFSVLRLNERYADKGMVGFLAYARAGFYLNPLGTAKPVLKLTQHA